MNAKIYNYQNEYIEAPITHDVVRIDVQIISGDEVVAFTYDNDSKVCFDSGEINRRLEDISDGCYAITDPQEIQDWLNFIPTEHPQSWKNQYSYQRMNMLSKKPESDDDVDCLQRYIAIEDLPDPKPVEEGTFSNEDFTKVYNRGFADGWNTLLQEIKKGNKAE